MAHKIIAIAQLYNEIRRGNLDRFLSHLIPLVDDLVVYDDGSTDGTYKRLLRATPHVLRGVRNDFHNERAHRQLLVEKARELGADFILWLDADEVLTNDGRKALQRLADECLTCDADAISLHEINLWRSENWRRMDNAYDDGWFVRLWRMRPDLAFRNLSKPGLHQQLFPDSIRTVVRSEKLSVLHYGFASDEGILYKYLNYERHGQSGWPLQRLVDESTLEIRNVQRDLVPEDLWKEEQKPVARSAAEWQMLAREKKAELLRPGVSIACLIYKSTQWLDFVYTQMLRHTDLHDKEFFFIANDATQEVKDYLHDHYIPHYIFENTPKHKQEWYINNVYRAWNFAAEKARGDYIVFINSDMAFSPGWVEALLDQLCPNNCVASRLVESGKMPSGTYGISKNFGRVVNGYREKAFLRYARSIATHKVHDGGLFMPLLIRREHFLSVGGYPEGNVVPESDFFQPRIALQGDPLVSGDVVLMNKLQSKGITHQTVFDSIVYHFQEGEMDDPGYSATSAARPKIAIVNDYLRGRMGETTMWNILVERLPITVGMDMEMVGWGEKGFASRVRRFLARQHSEVDMVIQNATFLETIDKERYTVVYLQDDLRAMGRRDERQEQNIRHANLRICNSFRTAASYSEFFWTVIPIGVDTDLFRPGDKEKTRAALHLPHQRTGIFVGDLSPVKGWNTVRLIIKQRPDIHWIVVSKSEERFDAPNVTMFNRIDQKLLAQLYQSADFFLLGSPVETQCLAAIEAGMCDVPILMHTTGIFADFSDEERSNIGIFTEDLAGNVDAILNKTFSPRNTLLEKNLYYDGMVAQWTAAIKEARFQVDIAAAHHGTPLTLAQCVIKMGNELRAQSIDGINVVKRTLKKILPKPLADILYRVTIGVIEKGRQR